MKTSFSILTIILISLCQLYAREGDKVLNGGEPCEDRIEMIRDDIKQWIHDNGHLGLELGSTITHTQYANRMKSAFDSITSIRCSEQLETIGPTPKTCTNGIDQHGTAFIRCNRQRFISDSTEEEQYRLIHHEYASYSNLEKSNNSISNYSISNQITAFLEWQLVKKLAVKKYTDKLFWSGSEMCIVKKNRPLYCWGHDTDPRLNRLSIDNLSSIGVGVNTTCVYFKDQEEVECYGTYPSRKRLPHVKQLAATISYACALIERRLKCWNFLTRPKYDQNSIDHYQKAINEVEKIKNVKEVSGDWQTMCVIDLDDRLTCVGNPYVSSKLPKRKLENPTHLQVKGHSTVCLKENGIDKCWGNEDYFSPFQSAASRHHPDYGSLVKITPTANYLCALTSNKMARCFGQGSINTKKMYNKYTTREAQELPLPRQLYLGDVLDIASGKNITCAIIQHRNHNKKRSVHCWSYVWKEEYNFGNFKINYKGLSTIDNKEEDTGQSYVHIPSKTLLDEIINRDKLDQVNNYLNE